MGSSYGDNFRITLFGESHGAAVGVTVEGVPAGSRLDYDELCAFMSRRAPGRGIMASQRREPDLPEFLSGIKEDVFTGTPVTVVIHNHDARRSDYDAMRYTPRPGHADYTAEIKYFGHQDASGGGHFSARLTAPLCAAGGIAIQLLRAEGITISSRIVSVGGETDEAAMEAALIKAASAGDSLGGVVECSVEGVPAGLGDPIFGGMENRIAAAVFGIPAVKGVEFGAGFAAASMRGSENNDEFAAVEEGGPDCASDARTAGGAGETSGAESVDPFAAYAPKPASSMAKNRRVITLTNNAGGILGGISDGMPIVFRAAFKPTPSIALPQRTVDMKTLEEKELTVRGRHDPCVALRALPAVEAAAAIAVLDAWLERKKQL